MFGLKEDSPMTGLKIELVERASTGRGNNSTRQLSVQKNGRIVFGDAGLQRLNIGLDDYVLIGKVGESWYVCKRPTGSFKGYKLTNQKGKNAMTVYIQSKSLLEIDKGEYVLSAVIEQDGLAWHQLISTDA